MTVEEGQPSRPRSGAGADGAVPEPAGAAVALLREPAPVDLGVPGSEAVPSARSCDFRGAYVFAAGHSPSEALCGPKCNGTVAENTIRAGNGPEHESKFSLCTRHSDLLWLLGYHGELRDGTLLHAHPAATRADG